MTATAVTVGQVEAALRRWRFRYAGELQLQDGIELALERERLDYIREARLDARSRIDFLVGRVGVEVKVLGTRQTVQRQVDRYLQHDGIDALLLVTTRSSHVAVCSRQPGKAVTVICLNGAGL